MPKSTPGNLTSCTRLGRLAPRAPWAYSTKGEPPFLFFSLLNRCLQSISVSDLFKQENKTFTLFTIQEGAKGWDSSDNILQSKRQVPKFSSGKGTVCLMSFLINFYPSMAPAMPKSTPGNLTSCTSLGRLFSLHQGISSINRWHNLPEELPAAFAIIKLSRLEMTSKLSNPTRPGSKEKERCDVLPVG